VNIGVNEYIVVMNEVVVVVVACSLVVIDTRCMLLISLAHQISETKFTPDVVNSVVVVSDVVNRGGGNVIL
jgi:hypothetical protein